MLMFLLHTSWSGINVAVVCTKVQRHLLKPEEQPWGFPISELSYENDTYLERILPFKYQSLTMEEKCTRLFTDSD
jgi:hypothetical protein